MIFWNIVLRTSLTQWILPLIIFPGILVPSDAYLYHIKQKAFRLGLEISGTGVRNDFTDTDPAIRRAGVELVKNWILAAEKLGAPVIRVFSGRADPEGPNRPGILEYLIADLKECTEFGKAHGVMVAVQNHNDFIRTADEAIEIVRLVNSDWFGLILDVGSYRTGDLYDQVARSIPYTVSWQLKEMVYVDGVEQKADMDRLMGIIMNSGYRGYLPIETLGDGDPKAKVARFLDEVREAMNRTLGATSLVL